MDKQNSQPMSFVNIALALANDYCQIYVINPENDSYVEYVPSGLEKSLLQISEGENFFEAVPNNCREQVWKDDQENFLATFKREKVMKSLEDDMSFSLTYRLDIGGNPRYFFLKAIRAIDKSIIIGVRDIDSQKRKELEAEEASRKYSEIAQSLASMFEIIYYIDMETGHYTEYSSSECFTKQGFGKEGKDFFLQAMTDIQRVIHPDDRQRMLDELEKDTFISALRSSGSVSISYRQLIDGREQYMKLMAFIQNNNKEHIVIGVRNVDKKVRREMSMLAENQRFNNIAEALAQKYEVIYHVNIVTNEYIEYSSSKEYASLKVGAKGEDFFKTTQINMQTDIYKDDLERMKVAMQKENLLSSLMATGKTTYSYRLMLKGIPQYVTLDAVLPKEDSEHIIIAVSNVDKAKKMEMDYINAMDMANKDALTGVKNKRAFVQIESELDEQIQRGEKISFAVVVCDVNGLKQINDSRGHKAGDEFIRRSCSIICDIFKHSPVFRIGGDEFTVILKGNDYTNRNDLMKQLKDMLDEHRHNGVVILAAGMSEFIYNRDIRVQDIFERADTLMYADKEFCKAQRR